MRSCENLVLLEPYAAPRIQFSELLIEPRQQRFVVRAPPFDQIFVRSKAALPRVESNAQVVEVEVVLQRRLEVVRRRQFRQVVGFGRFGQRPQPDHPVLVLANFFAHQRLQESAALHAVDRRVQLVEFRAVRLQRLAVQQSGAPVDGELAVCIRQREHRFLHRRVGLIALHQDVPRHHARFRNASPTRRPSRNSATPGSRTDRTAARVRERSSPATKSFDCISSVPRTRFDLSRIAIVSSSGALTAPALSSSSSRRLAVVTEQVRDRQVVVGETDQRLAARETLQNLRGFVGAAGIEVDVRAQEFDVVANLLRHAPVNPVEALQRIGQLALLELNAREPIGGVVANRFVDVAFEHRRDRVPGAQVHPVVEFEVADRKLGGVDQRIQRVEVRLVEAVVLREFGIEPRKRLEVQPLLRVVDRLGEIQVARPFVVGARPQP